MRRLPVVPRLRRPHIRRMVMCGLATVALFESPTAGAQASPADGAALRDGARVRLTPTSASSTFPNAAKRIGTLRSVRNDSVTVAWVDGGAATIPFSRIERLELSRGPRRFVLRGMIIGALAGAGVGAIIGAASYSETACVDPCIALWADDPLGRNLSAAAGAAIGGLGGLAAGAAIGAGTRRESWQHVPLVAITNRVHVGAFPHPSEPGLRVAIAW